MIIALQNEMFSECSYVNWMSAKFFNNSVFKFIEGGLFLEKSDSTKVKTE